MNSVDSVFFNFWWRLGSCPQFEVVIDDSLLSLFLSAEVFLLHFVEELFIENIVIIPIRNNT